VRKYLAGIKCGDYLAALALDSEHSFAAEPCSRSVTPAQTIPSASKTTQRRFVSTSKISARCRTDERVGFIPSSRRDLWT
jgi:hypothetical protein